MIGKLAIRVTSYVVAILRANGGAATVELAMVIPMLMMMLVGAVDFGLVIHQKMQLAHAVRAGAQHALVSSPLNKGGLDQTDLTAIETAILDGIAWDANPTRNVTAALFCECTDGSVVACGGTGICPLDNRKHQYISVTVEEDFETLFDYPAIGKSVHLKNDATFRLDFGGIRIQLF